MGNGGECVVVNVGVFQGNFPVVLLLLGDGKKREGHVRSRTVYSTVLFATVQVLLAEPSNRGLIQNSSVGSEVIKCTMNPEMHPAKVQTALTSASLM